MDLKEQVAQIIKEEMGDCVAGLSFAGPYAGEEFTVDIRLRYEPADLEERNARMRDRVWQLGRYVGLVFDWPEEAVAV
ncbi:MAG: hypothetical protein HY318_12165 [Armatimonadetes bacterium]|nr:hypothetical protein [Armatimonadota bacterium]